MSQFERPSLRDCKYYFASSNNGKTHVIVAKNEKNARKLFADNEDSLKCLYELKGDTFKEEGFLVTNG